VTGDEGRGDNRRKRDEREKGERKGTSEKSLTSVAFCTIFIEVSPNRR
jgi:hypothetical protein